MEDDDLDMDSLLDILSSSSEELEEKIKKAKIEGEEKEVWEGQNELLKVCLINL